MSNKRALFSLKPCSSAANRVVADDRNSDFRLELGECGTRVLNVGHIPSKSRGPNVLVTLGRDADIIVMGKSISKLQWQFVVNRDTGLVLFEDRLFNRSSRVFGGSK